MAEKSTRDLVREAIDEMKELVRLEAELAKREAKRDLKEMRSAGVLIAGAAASLVVCFAMLGVAIVLAAGGTVIAALIVAACFFVLSAILAGIGYAFVPRKPLERTRERATSEARQLRERAT